MKLEDAVIWWTPADRTTPDAGNVTVAPRGKSYHLEQNGSILDFGRPPTREGEIAKMFLLFHIMVVRGGISPAAAHQEFLRIDDYRKHIVPDLEGAEE